MDKIIQLLSGKESNFLKRLNSITGDSYVYILDTKSPITHVGYNNMGIKFIYPSGGPMLIKGVELEEAKAVIKSISHVVGKGYIITFDNK